MGCLADKNEAAFTEVEIWKEYYTDNEVKYDWDVAPSNFDRNLVNAVYATPELWKLHIYKLDLEHEFESFLKQLHSY